MKTKQIVISILIALSASPAAFAGGAATGGASELTQILNNIELGAMHGIQAGEAAVQGNQFVMQSEQYAQQISQYIRQGLQLDALMRNLTNPQFYSGKITGTTTYRQGAALYGAANGTASKSTRDAVGRVQQYGSIMSPPGGGAPSATALVAHNAGAASAAAATVTVAQAKQADLAVHSKTVDDVSANAGNCDGSNDCERAVAALTGENAQVNISIASTLAAQQADQAARDSQNATNAARAAQTMADMEAQRQKNIAAFNVGMTPPAKP